MTTSSTPRSKNPATPATTVAKKSGFQKPVTLSTELADVIGAEPIPRTEVTKKVWDYIKLHNLQDKVDKRMINADAKLLVIFGGKKQVSMFEMTSLLSKHMH